MTNGVTSKSINDFYSDIIGDLVRFGKIDPDAPTLVVCGGDLDRRMLQAHGFSRVMISNGCVRLSADTYAPYDWSIRNVEKTISTYDPTGPTNIRYFHDVALPLLPTCDRNNVIKLAVSKLIRVPWFVRTFVPRQGNRFAFWIGKL